MGTLRISTSPPVNSPSTFQRVMEHVFGDLNLSELVLYLDDLLVYSSTFDDHITRLDKVFSRFRQYNLRLNGSKCQLFRSSVVHLGHVVDSKGVSVGQALPHRLAITLKIVSSARLPNCQPLRFDHQCEIC